VTGTNADYLTVRGRAVAEGRNFTENEGRSGAGVCLLGETVRESLFGTKDALGAEVRVGSVPCTVVGILDVQGENMMGMDQDDLVLMPMRTVQSRILGSLDVGSISVSAKTAADMDQVRADMDAVLRERRGVTSDETVNFSVHDTREMASTLGNITGVLTAFLAAVAGVSLLVGGIGIMNIMLVSVTERTREIGIRMAIGALESDIRTQFLVEAGVLAVCGGAVGAALGIGGTVAASLGFGIPLVISPTVVVISVVFSGLMGVGFGWVPARNAARLEPIDALRHT
jgi:putative ABC transport system permease protein